MVYLFYCIQVEWPYKNHKITIIIISCYNQKIAVTFISCSNPVMNNHIIPTIVFLPTYNMVIIETSAGFDCRASLSGIVGQKSFLASRGLVITASNLEKWQRERGWCGWVFASVYIYTGKYTYYICNRIWYDMIWYMYNKYMYLCSMYI